MRTEFIYSVIALGAVPVVMNAADVKSLDVIQSTTGSKEVVNVGKLVPGSYTFKAQLTSKVYGVKVKIAGKEVEGTFTGNNTAVSFNFDLDKETDVNLELVSTDPGEAGAGFQIADAVVILNFDLAKAKAEWTDAINALKTTQVAAYDYDDDEEKADKDAADKLIAKLNKIADTYEEYVAQKLYQKASVPQGEIDALEAQIKGHQNTQAYNNVNAAITAIKAKYNDAVADIKESLVKEALYLQESALKDLNDKINEKITEATQASYASYQAGTAVIDEVKIKEEKIPTEKALNDIVNDWKGQGTTNQAAYDALQKKVTDQQAALDAAVPEESVASLFPKTDAQAAIDALNTKIENAKNSAAQLTLDVTKEEAAAAKVVSEYAAKVGKANAEYKANEATVAAIKTLQDNLDAAKAAVNAMKSADGNYEAKNYYDAYVTAVQKEIDDLSAAAAKAYKADGTGSAVDYNTSLNTAPTQAKIDVYGGTTEPAVDGQPKKAVDKYNALQTAMASYQKDLDAARAKVKDLDVYTAEGYDYETEFNKIQKRIKDIQKNIDAAKGKVGAEHWTAMIAIDADAAITTDIATLLSKVQADENKYDADHLADGMKTLEDKITAFKAKDATVLGEDVNLFKNVEKGIETAYNAVKASKEAINPSSETVRYTERVETVNTAWWGNPDLSADWNPRNGYTGTGASPAVTTDDGRTQQMVENYNSGSCTVIGEILSQTISNLENGTYSVVLCANAFHANNVDNANGITEDANDVAYVFANGIKKYIVAKNASSTTVNGEYTIDNVKVTDGTLKIGLGKDKKGTNWHNIQIKSLKANTASLIQDWGKKVDDLNKQQTALETTANAAADKVAANTSNKTTLATSIGDNEATPKTGMWKSIDDFKTLYKIGTAESTLGNRGKADGEVTKAVATLVEDLTALQTANTAVDPTKVNPDDKSSAVNNTPSGWALADMAHTGNANRLTGDKIDGKQLAEQYTSAGAADYGKAGIVMKQKLTGLANGIYDVVLYANAVDQASGNPNKDKTDIAYVYANDIKVPVKVTAAFNATQEGYKLENIVVSDGTLELGLAKAKGGTNWHSILLKSLNYHENSQDALYNNADEKNPGLNNRYTKLNETLNALKDAAPGIKTAVEANAATNTAATGAVTALQDAELATLKSLKNVTNADAVNDDATALKEAPAGYNFKVFETGLAADKNYTAKKKAIDDDIKAMSDAIAASNANESLKEDWKNNSITVVITPDDEKTPDVDETVKKTYSIAALTQTINDLKTEAGSESDNWEAYKSLLDNNWSKLQPDTITMNATVAGEGALTYYQGLKDDYIAAKATILTNMQKALTDRKAVSTKNSFVEEIAILIDKVKVVKSDAEANLKKYNEQKKAYQDTQTLWNSTYTEIAATDHSSKVQEYLDELDAIQVELTAATNAVEANYPKGESVAKAQDFAVIKGKINNVKSKENSEYNANVVEDNLNAHKAFTNKTEGESGAIEQTQAVFNDAVAERGEYSSTNAIIQKAIDAAAAVLDQELYDCPTKIQNLTTTESEAYVAITEANAKLPEGERFKVYDSSDYITQALTIEQDITSKLSTFRTDIAEAMYEVWVPLAKGYNEKVTNAETAIEGYSADAKKDAFKNVKDAIANGYNAVTIEEGKVVAVNIKQLEAAITELEDIDNMLAADKDAAAAKDISVAVTAANKAYNETKTYIEGKTIADDYKNVKQTQLDNLEEAKGEADVILEEYPAAKWTFANHEAIKPALAKVVTVANDAKTDVDNAIVNDKANTKAYEDIIAAITPLEAKLAEAKEATAPYKYQTSFKTEEGLIEQGKSKAKEYKEAGTAVANKEAMLANIAAHANDIEATLTTAFGNEKAGLASTDIPELKNQYNTYVAANGLDAASAYKKDIDELEKALTNAAIVEVDDPADGIKFNDILDATAKLIKLQNDIADKESELLEANGKAANAEVLADFNTQIGKLEQTASLEGYDEWVGKQKVNDKTINSWLEEINGQIADVKTAINAEKNIAFYKNQYQASINAIKDKLDPVTKAIKAYDKQFKDNAAAYATLSAKINELQGKITAAKTKVGGYTYLATKYLDILEKYDNLENPKELTGGVQYDVNILAEDLELYNESKEAQYFALDYDFDNQVEYIESEIKSYLDKSAYEELEKQRKQLNTNLSLAIDIPNHEGVQKYSSALWARLIAEKNGISKEITNLQYPIWNSYQVYESTGMWVWKLDDDKNMIPKACTSDDEYANQKAEIDRIQKEIDNLGEAVNNLKLLGDANVDGKVNVLDYQKVLNMILDPSLQPDPESEDKTQADLFANIDINQSTVIEVGDLTAIVNYILNGDWQGYAAARSFNRGDNENLSLNYSSVNSDVQRIAVNLENANNYTAFQMDVVLPDGMKIVGTSLSSRAGQSHKLYSRTQQDGSVRILASSISGETFSGNEGAVLYIDVEGAKASSVEILNILFSDVNANTRAFKLGNNVTGIDAIGSTFDALKQKVYDLGGRVMNGVKKGINIIRNADGSTRKVAE